MNDKTPFTSKLIIILLVLVLAALGVIIFQNTQKRPSSESAAVQPDESYSEIPLPRLGRTHVPPTVPMTNRTKLAPRSTPAPVASASRPNYSSPLSTDSGEAAQNAGSAPQPFFQPVPVPAGSVTSGAGTEISGHVLLSGVPPPEKIIDFSGPNEATCGKLHPAPVTTRHYVVGPEGELANVFVYIKEGAPHPTPAASGPLLDQVGCLYEPYVLGVMAGQKLSVRNSDPFMHNVHVITRAKGNSSINVAQTRKGQINGIRFDKPEVLVRLQCDIHPWMFAFIGVTDNPYFAVSDKEGKFAIRDLPPGVYTVEAVHPKAGRQSQQITIGNGQRQSVDFNFSVPNVSPLKIASGN